MTVESNFLKGTIAVQQEDFSEYVAHLQFHMTLQARNLVPTLKQTLSGSREELLHQTQANLEKVISRQAL